MPGRRRDRPYRRPPRSPDRRPSRMTQTSSDIASSIGRVEPIYDRVVAIAGMLQALAQVRRVADTGEANDRVLTTCIESLFRFDAPTTAAVYGGLENVRPGLLLLRDYLDGKLGD